MSLVPGRRNCCLSRGFPAQINFFLFFKRRRFIQWNLIGLNLFKKKKQNPKQRENSNGAFQMWRVCFGFRGTQKSPKETLFALSGSENSPVLLGRSKSPFPGVGRGCAASRGTQLTEEALKLQPFVFILLKYLHCDANADFQSEKEEEKKNISFSLCKLL